MRLDVKTCTHCDVIIDCFFEIQQPTKTVRRFWPTKNMRFFFATDIRCFGFNRSGRE